MSQDSSVHYSASMVTDKTFRGGYDTGSKPDPLQQDPLNCWRQTAATQDYPINHGNTLTSGNVCGGYDTLYKPELLQQNSLDYSGSLPQYYSIDYSGNMLNNKNNHGKYDTVSRPNPLQQDSLNRRKLSTISSLNPRLGPLPAKDEPYYQYCTQSAGRQQEVQPKGQGNMISSEYHRSTALNISQGQVHNHPQERAFFPYNTSYSSNRQMNSLDRPSVGSSSTYKPSTSTPFDKPRHSAQPFQLYNKPNNSATVMIPHPRYTSSYTNAPHAYQHFFPDEPIYFSVNNVIGFPMKDALAGSFAALDGRDDQFLNGGPSVSLRFEWPGYDSWSVQIKTKDWKKTPMPITRAKLVAEIAKQLNNFLRIVEKEKIKTPYAVWTVGHGFIDINRLLLVRLDHVSKGSRQPYFSLLC